MAELTPGEFDRMQREARARVFEMNKRSRFITEELNAKQPEKNRSTTKAEHEKEEESRTAKRNIQNQKETESQHDTDIGKEKDDGYETLFLFLLSELLRESNRDVADFLLLLLLL